MAERLRTAEILLCFLIVAIAPSILHA